MSLDFKLHYDRLREGDPTKPEASATVNEKGAFYEGPSHARNLCLVWPDGKRQFLSYAYLIGGTFTPGEEMNEITLNFSTHVVTLKGYGLEKLFITLLDQLPKVLVQTDNRYIDPENAVVITRIVVTAEAVES